MRIETSPDVGRDAAAVAVIDGRGTPSKTPVVSMLRLPATATHTTLGLLQAAGLEKSRHSSTVPGDTTVTDLHAIPPTFRVSTSASRRAKPEPVTVIVRFLCPARA